MPLNELIKIFQKLRTHSKASNVRFLSGGKEAAINWHRDSVDKAWSGAQEEKNTLDHIINLCKPWTELILDNFSLVIHLGIMLTCPRESWQA